MKNIAMIPAAGRGTRMLSLTDNNPKAMLPMANKPIIGHQLEWLIENKFEDVIIIVGYKSEKIINYVADFYADKIKVRFAKQEKLDGLASAIHEGLEQLTQKEKDEDALFILLGDLIPGENSNAKNNLNRNFIAYDVVEDWKRWCMIGVNDHKVISFYDKLTSKPPTNKNIVGIYNFSNISLLDETIKEVLAEKLKIRGEYQFSQALSKFIRKEDVEAIYFPDFHDLGQASALNKTRKNITRHFNKVALLENGNIRKSSSKVDKLRNEVKWYDMAPKSLKKYLPEIKDHGAERNGYFYEMEYIQSTPLQELFLYNLPEEKEWRNIFKEIKKYIEKTFIMTQDDNEMNMLLKANYDILIRKTEQRVEIVKDMFPHKTYAVNGKLYKNPIFYLESIFNKVDKLCLSNVETNYGYVHGDLFFGNMMYDIKDSKLTLIDPRGEYGDFINKGDVRYDLAKLNHSIYGYYDFIVNELYALDDKGAILNYNFYDSQQKHAQIIFDEMLSELTINKEDIDLITGLLFLSMIPLHKENEKNQKMQFIKSMEFLNKYI